MNVTVALAPPPSLIEALRSVKPAWIENHFGRDALEAITADWIHVRRQQLTPETPTATAESVTPVADALMRQITGAFTSHLETLAVFDIYVHEPSESVNGTGVIGCIAVRNNLIDVTPAQHLTSRQFARLISVAERLRHDTPEYYSDEWTHPYLDTWMLMVTDDQRDAF